MKNGKMKKGFRLSRKLFLFIICTFLFFFFSIATANHIGKGDVEKTCEWNDGTPIEGAWVTLFTGEGGLTDSSGKILFEDVEVGINYISVDIDNEDPHDWDTELEEITVVGGETLYITNTYTPPTI